MAAKNSIKIYADNGYYHIYNRGVEKRNIFVDSQDYAVFLSYLKTYLLPKDENTLQQILISSESSPKDKSIALKTLRLKNFSDEIELLCYALMPNHFHLLIKQRNADGIDRFINSLGTRYTVYFNHKYKRVGPLCQGVYKAVLITSDEQLLHLSRYIHLNPLIKNQIPVEQWSQIKNPFSLPEYLGQRQTDWVKTDYILNYFNQTSPHNSYLSFLKDGPQLDKIQNESLDAIEVD